MTPPSALRAAAEQLTHRLVFRRRLPPPFSQARIYVSSEGGLRYLKPNLRGVDPPLLRLVSEVVRPGSVVWDIGANLGLFSFAAAALAGPTGRVLAVEADSWLVALLRRSASVNRALAPVDVLPVAASDSVGVDRFCIARRCRSTNHLDGFGTTEAGGTRRVEIVPTVTLDSLLAHFPRPDVIKIDVEQAEAIVLCGASSVLSTRPTLICEVAAENAGRVREQLAPYGYVLYDGCVPVGQRRPLDRVPWALLALPSRAGAMANRSASQNSGAATSCSTP